MGTSAEACHLGSGLPVRGSLACTALAAALGVASAGCQRELDMARIHGQERAATTIRYHGVREETRVYPDYSAIDARILSPKATGARPRP